MRLYLVRHGEATAPEENPRRPLSAKGRAEVERMASFLARGGVRPRRVLHSGKLRAGETAAILARALAPGLMLEEAENLNPEDTPARLLSAARGWVAAAMEGRGNMNAAANDILLVGHMPFMAQALAALVGAGAAGEFADFAPGGAGRPNRKPVANTAAGPTDMVAFATGAVACLESDNGKWRLLWLVAPELLGG